MKTTAQRSAATLAAGVMRICAIVGDGLNGLTDAIRRRIGWQHAYDIVRRAAPYFLLAVLPGGSLLALLLFLHRRRSLGAPHTVVAGQNDTVVYPETIQCPEPKTHPTVTMDPQLRAARHAGRVSVTSATQFGGCETQPWCGGSQMSTGASSSFDGR